MREWIVGRNPVYEVLRAERRQIFGLKFLSNAKRRGRLADIIDLCERRNIEINSVTQGELKAIKSNHQGVALEVSGFPYSTINDIVENYKNKDELPFLLFLDSLQDPQNLGSLIRTAEIVGVHGIFLPFRRTATITPAVVNASSGACEHLLITQVNFSQALTHLKKEGVWVIGLDESEISRDLSQVRMDGAIALVVGAEGQGMRSLVKGNCDFLMRLPMKGKIESLNAAVAGSVALYLVWQARGF